MTKIMQYMIIRSAPQKLKTGLISLCFILTACAPRPTAEELKDTLNNKYLNNSDAYELLAEMITSDVKSDKCLAVGYEHVGPFRRKGYFENGDERWYRINYYEVNITTEQVLQESGLSVQRYDRYKSILEKAQAERVTKCANPELNTAVTILVYRSGISISGCIGQIRKSEQIPESRGNPDSGNFREITPLAKNWYLDFDCT